MVLEEVPPNCTVVGVPGRVVKRDNTETSPGSELDQCPSAGSGQRGHYFTEETPSLSIVCLIWNAS